ncbi:MAG TPA: hypothetical protein VN700_03665 [Vicinamibacterales bacterium]|nr:hypothetical protein [Vicinamibacterales bacterium]
MIDIDNDARSVSRLLSDLATAEPDAARSLRTRAKCAAMFADRARAASAREHRTAFRRRIIAPALVGGFCVVYLSVIVMAALRWLSSSSRPV